MGKWYPLYHAKGRLIVYVIATMFPWLALIQLCKVRTDPAVTNIITLHAVGTER